MTHVLSVQAKQTGYPGAPGWTTLCFSPLVELPDADKVVAAFNFWTDMAHNFPPDWKVTLQGPCQIQDVATGELVGVFPVPLAQQLTQSGDAPSEYGAGVAGACISWYTASNGNGRPPRGRSFMVPLAADKWQSDGTLLQGTLDNFQAQAQSLIDAGVGFGVWRRPKFGAGGEFFTAIQARISDKAAFLSSRRE